MPQWRDKEGATMPLTQIRKERTAIFLLSYLTGILWERYDLLDWILPFLSR
jgi:hypothetical protein